ncbi:MAG: PIG-L deacetylase family protein [Actinomycetota bacterium]
MTVADAGSAEVRRALIVGAHPDDPELFAGGTAARWARAGAAVRFLLLTDGRMGTQDPDADLGDVARSRIDEAVAAAAVIGAEAPVFAGFPDGELVAHRAAATEVVARAIREFRPDVVVGHDPWRPYEPHPDHRAAGFATCDGVVAAREWHALPALRAAGLDPHRPREVWLMGTGAPDRFVDITATFESKVAALAAHAGQFASVKGWRRRVEDWNARIGAEVGCGFAEAFHDFAVS